MKSLLDLYGQQFRNPMLNSDSEDYTTADVFGQMGANKRRAEYDNSLLGMVHNWATGEQRQPVQLPDDASWLDQAKEAGLRMLNLPNDMAAGGAKTMAHWLGAAGNPEMVEPLDMLAPLGIGAMAGMAGGLPSNSVGIFGGKLAKTADHAALARAEQMAAQGVDRDTIWKDTGWGRGVDGQWRFEIDDSAMPPMEFLPDKRLLAEKIYPQHEANKAYPGIEIASDPAVSINGGLASSSVGPTGRLLIGINSRLDPDTRRSAYLHEMQHSGPQATEGFARGGSMFDPEYSRLAGEVEARTVQKRANMTADERRARPMWYDYDVPENQQIVRLTADQSRSSLPGLAANALDIKHDVELKRIPFGGREHVTAGVGDSMFEAAWDGDTLRMFGGRVVDDQRGGGVGTSIYHALANEAFSKGGKLASDAAVSAAAQRIYAGFAKRGFDVHQSPAAKPGKGGGGSLVTDDGSPVFTVGPSGDRTSGTPGTDDRLNKIFSDQSRSSIPGLLAGAADEPRELDVSAILRMLQGAK